MQNVIAGMDMIQRVIWLSLSVLRPWKRSVGACVKRRLMRRHPQTSIWPRESPKKKKATGTMMTILTAVAATMMMTIMKSMLKRRIWSVKKWTQTSASRFVIFVFVKTGPSICMILMQIRQRIMTLRHGLCEKRHCLTRQWKSSSREVTLSSVLLMDQRM